MAFSWGRALGALAVVVVAMLIGYLALFLVPPSRGTPVWGVHFSKAHATYLRLDWRASYTALLDDVGVRRLRLGAYWNEIEPQQGVFQFDDLDWMLDQAHARNTRVLLAVGQRLPRWPECHMPDWVRALPLPEQHTALQAYVQRVVERYRSHPTLGMWQVENEPFLGVFGECPPGDGELLAAEVAQVRALDAAHPVLITDSGELSFWMRSGASGDWLGHTLYRTVWNPWIGYLSYDHILPPAWYRWKAWLAGKPADRMIVAELQAEPWIAGGDFFALPLEEQRKSMDRGQLLANIDFARAIGFPEVYLWGSEYWYWLKTTQEDASLWDAARAVFRGGAAS